jgi:hypothetical protein
MTDMPRRPVHNLKCNIPETEPITTDRCHKAKFHVTVMYMECDYSWILDWLDSWTQHMSILYNSLLHTHILVSTVISSLTIAWYQLPTVDIPLTLGSWTIPGPSYQLLTATAHNSWTSATRLTELTQKSKMLYNWRFTANQPILASSPLRPQTRFFFSTEPLQ